MIKKKKSNVVTNSIKVSKNGPHQKILLKKVLHNIFLNERTDHWPHITSEKMNSSLVTWLGHKQNDGVRIWNWILWTVILFQFLCVTSLKAEHVRLKGSVTLCRLPSQTGVSILAQPLFSFPPSSGFVTSLACFLFVKREYLPRWDVEINKYNVWHLSNS